MKRLLIALSSALLVHAHAADTPSQARTALLKGAQYLRSISAEGGYLWRYSLDLKLVAGEGRATRTMQWLQPSQVQICQSGIWQNLFPRLDPDANKYLLF